MHAFPKVKILTDSTADLSPELVRKFGVSVIPFIVNFGSDSFLDGVDITTQRLFELVEERKMLPKTAAPAPGDFYQAFKAAAEDGSQVIYVGISSKLSSGLETARIVASQFPGGQVQVFDSANLSTGIGLQVLAAVEMARAGKSQQEILAELERIAPRVRTSFIIDTLDYLRMGGRCSAVQALVGALLQIRPMITVVDGAMTVGAKVRGSRKKALDHMLEGFVADAAFVAPDRVFVTHTGCHDDAEYLIGEIKRAAPHVREVIETTAGAVIGSHCGPNTIGILYVVS